MFLGSGVDGLYLSGFRLNIVYTFKVLGASIFSGIFAFVEVMG